MISTSSDLFTVHQGDARRLRRLLDRITEPNTPPLTCTITSPPYGAMKNYGHEDQIGWGQPHADYLVEMRRVFRSLYQYTRDDGSMWVIADTLRGDEGRRAGTPQKMEPLPFQLADEATDAGWILRETLIWQKHKTLPWSSGRRLRNVFEYVLLFVKGADYKFCTDRLRDPDNLEQWWVKWPERYNPNGKVPTNVWDIPIPQQGAWGSSDLQHVCPLPPDLVERLILLSTDEGDVVFDPFAGTGVVIAEAQRLGRRALGLELNKRYVRAFAKSVRPEIAKRTQHDVVALRAARAEQLRDRIIRLRAMKYPKVLWQQLAKDGSFPSPQLIVAQMAKPRPDTMTAPLKPLPVNVLFVYAGLDPERLQEVERRLKELTGRPPAAKFGIAGTALAISADDIKLHLRREALYLYAGGRTWDAVGRVRPADLLDLGPELPVRKGNHAYPPIVGNVEVHETPGLAPSDLGS